MSTSRVFQFAPRRSRAWKGRYRRIPGRTTVNHVRLLEGEWWPVVDWTVDDETAECPMLDSGDVQELVDAVHAGKGALGAPPGGSFLVNEFGQVLVPATEQETTRVVHVGDCDGPFAFHNVFQPGKTFDLADARTLKPGGSWERPYVGIPHNLSHLNEICFRQTDDLGTTVINAPGQDEKLIAALRRIRPYGWVRFIVGIGGIVVTKVQVGASEWEPRYVGRIDPARWFRKEG